MTRQIVIVAKNVALLEGESVSQYTQELHDAIRAGMGGGGDGFGLEAAFADHAIARRWETGQLYRVAMSRDASGAFLLGPPVEVRVAYVPVSVQKDAGGQAPQGPQDLAQHLEADVQRVDVEVREDLWVGLFR